MSGMRGWLMGALFLLAVPQVRAQAPPPDVEQEVMQVVDRLFDAMRDADSATVRSLFHPELEKMASSFRQRDGAPTVRYGDLAGFAESVGGAEPGEFDERLGAPRIVLHDDLATVFTPYAFYLRGQLSHCGVNVFIVARSGDEWKIVGLADTRRRQDCEEWLK